MAWLGKTDYWVFLNQLEKKNSELEEKNYKQASMLMERDFTIRQLEGKLMKKIQEEKDDKDNVIDLAEARLALASKEPPSSGDWLRTLSQGVSFLAHEKGSSNPFHDVFFVGTDPKMFPAVLLGYELNNREGGFKWCDPVKFSNKYKFIMTIKDVTEVNNDGIAVQAGRVDSDGETQTVDPVHED